MTIVTSVRREFVVDVVHFLHRVVVDVGLGQQHVHVPGHPPGHRVDRVLHRDALVLEQAGQVLDGVLGLGDGHAVAGHDDDLVGVGHLDRGVGRRGRLTTLSTPSPLPTATPPPPKPPATIAGIERFIALAIRLVRIEPDAPTIMPATIIAVLFSAKPAAAADNPVIALSSEMTTGMSAPPIGSTTIKPSTAGGGQQPDHPPQRRPAPPGWALTPITTAAAIAAISSRMFSGCCSLADADRAAGQDLLQLAERDDRAPERDRPDDRGEQRRHHDVHGRRLAMLEAENPSVSMNSARRSARPCRRRPR